MLLWLSTFTFDPYVVDRGRRLAKCRNMIKTATGSASEWRKVAKDPHGGLKAKQKNWKASPRVVILPRRRSSSFNAQRSGSHTYILSVVVLRLGTRVGFITGRQAGAAILVKSSDHLSTLMSRAYYAQWQSGTLNRRQPGCMAPSWSISYRKRGRSRILGPGSESFSWALLWAFPLGTTENIIGSCPVSGPDWLGCIALPNPRYQRSSCIRKIPKNLNST